jgi:hypothetical protein
LSLGAGESTATLVVNGRTWIARLALGGGGVLLALLLLELVLRIVDPPFEVFNPLHGLHVGDARLGWRGKPNIARHFRKTQFDSVVVNDASGFRRPEPAPNEGAGEHVLLLGDSYAWGWGVSQGEVVSDRLQLAVGPDVAVHNRGVIGFGTGQEYLLLQEELARRRYSKVLLLFCVNDLQDNVDAKPQRPAFQIQAGAPVATNLPLSTHLQSRLEEWLDAHSRAASFLSYQFALAKELARRAPPDEARGPAASGPALDPRTLPGYDLTRALLLAMSDLSRQAGAELIVVYVATADDVRAEGGGAYGEAVRAAVRAICRDGHVAFVDLVPAFRARSSQGAHLVIPGDGHWTAAGHDLAAAVIRESVLAPRPSEPRRPTE